MTDWQPKARRALARELTRILNASVEEALHGLPDVPSDAALRIGVTGPPGAGKSVLISRLAERRLGRARRVGVLAIDPTSPISGGSLLGDRVRMETVAGKSDIYVRSVPSRHTHDGLCDNAADLLLTMESYGFDDILLETVGVGQTDFGVRILVDTVVLVLHPESGDTIQAMKAGILETADVLVVNKADLPGAGRTKAEVDAVLHRRKGPDGWLPPVMTASATANQGIDALDDAIERHAEWLREHRDARATRRQRMGHLVRGMIARRVAELLEEMPPGLFDGPVRDAYDHIVGTLVESRRAGPG